MTEQELHQRIIGIVGKDAFDKIYKRCQEHKIVNLRVILTKFYRQQGLTIYEISEKLNKDHATISHYIKMFGVNYEYSKSFRNLADEILK